MSDRDRNREVFALPRELAEIAYAAYGEFTRQLTHDGKAMPRWGDLPANTQQAWIAAAIAVARTVIQQTRR